MSDKTFFDMTPEERTIDLQKRVNQFNMLQLPGQAMVMHMGTSYLIDDLWRELQTFNKRTDNE